MHVHNSTRERAFFQERNIGPPDKNDEAERLDAAVARREAKEREEALRAAAAAGVAPAATLQGATTAGMASQPVATPANPSQ